MVAAAAVPGRRAGIGHNPRMGVICEYFAAPSDTVAASLIDTGPGARRPVSPALREALRTGDREAMRLALRPKVYSSDSGILVLPMKGSVDPVVQMGTLEELLTGETCDDISDRPRWGHVLAERHGGEKSVITLTDELQVALATATSDQLVVVARAWSETEEFFDQRDLDVLADLLLEFADLARQARQRGEHLYCWTCV